MPSFTMSARSLGAKLLSIEDTASREQEHCARKGSGANTRTPRWRALMLIASWGPLAALAQMSGPLTIKEQGSFFMGGEHRTPVGGEVPSPINPPSGCRFHTRCPYVFDRCLVEEPILRQMPGGGPGCAGRSRKSGCLKA